MTSTAWHPAASPLAAADRYPGKRTEWLIIGAAVFLAVVVLAMISVRDLPPDAFKPTPTPSPTIDAGTQLERATAFAAGKELKQSMRNPDSFEVEGAWASKDSKILCIKYRAQNGFGGMNVETVAWQDGQPKKSATFWNKHCTRNDLDDVTQIVKVGAKTAH